MAGPSPAVAQLRTAVRPGLTRSPHPVLVACSGGADSLALAAALAFEAARAGVPAGAVTVDHCLQPGSAERAQATGRRLQPGPAERSEATPGLLRKRGPEPCAVVPVRVGTDGGPEAAARAAR